MRVPHTIRTVADVIGMEAAVRLARAAYSNRQVYVPAGRIGPEHRISRVLMPDEVRSLQNHFGGELLPFPTLRGAKRDRASQLKQREIAADIKAGAMTHSAIARKHGVSKQWVHRVARKIESGS